MNIVRHAIPAALALSLFAAPQAYAGIPIDKACDQVFKEGKEESDVVNVGKHGFQIKKRKATVERTPGKITVTGYFWHKIVGENDRVFYTIEIQKGQPYKATIDRIEFGGLAGDNGKLKVGVKWTAKVGGGLAGAIITENPEGAAKGAGVGETVGKVALKLASKIQRKLIGDWTPSAPVILDGMANYFANQL